ncbi:MAG: hypothetical protein ABGZ35_26335, partial [Planctomycetaceae bacterium]
MEIRRLLLFLVVSFGFVLIWTTFVAEDRDDAEENIQAADIQAADVPAGDQAVDLETAAEPFADAEDADATDPTESAGPPVHERQLVVLGSLDPNSDYAIEATFSTEGASVSSVQLADPRMTDLTNRKEQVQVLGNNGSDHQTFSTTLDV